MLSTATANFGQLGHLNLVLAEPHAHAGVGVHRLTVTVEMSGSWLDRMDPQSYAAVLVTGNTWLQQPSYFWLGSLSSEVVILRGYGTSLDLVLPLSDDQIIAIEQARRGGDLDLQINFQATLLQAEGTFPKSEVQILHHVTADQWCRLLEQLGREVGIVIRVPSPLNPRQQALTDTEPPSLSRAVARLREARTYLEDLRYEQCAIACRKVLENLARLGQIPAAKQLEQSPQRRDQIQRWAALYWSTRELTNAAPHDDDVAAAFTWQQADAEGLLVTTAALVKRWTTDFASTRRTEDG